VEKECRVGHATDDKDGACALHAAYLGLHIHLGCVIVIAFPQQQWLHKHTSMLCYEYIACLVQNFTTETYIKSYWTVIMFCHNDP
jgi:hypothetical protein